MAEKFISKTGAIEIELFALETVTRFIGTPANPVTTDRVEMVRVRIPGLHGGCEIPLEEFHEFFYQKVFPAVARRTCQAKQTPKKR